MTFKAFRLIIIVIISAALIAPVPFANIPIANAASPEFREFPNILNPLSTDVRYIAVGSTIYNEFKFKVIDPDQPLGPHPLVAAENLPPGFSLEQLAPLPGWQVIWDTSTFASDPDFKYKLFLVTFIATADRIPSETAQLLVPFMLFKEGEIGPSVTLDNDRYLAGDTAYVTIYDLRKDLDGKNSAAEATLQTTSVDVEPGGPIELEEVDATNDPTVRSGTFRSSFVVSDPFTVSYDPGYGLPQSISKDVSATGVEFEKEKYSINQSAKIIAVTGDATPPTNLSLNTVGVTVPSWVDNDGRFETVLDLTALGKNTVTVSIGGAPFSDSTDVENFVAIFVNSTSQDQELSSFYTNQTAAVRVVDHQMNQNRTKAETINEVTVRTQFDSIEVPVTLLETGIDTGIFTGTNLIGFTNETSTDPNGKFVKMNPNVDQSATLTLRYLGSDRTSATVITVAPEESNQGIGDTSGTPVAATSIISITNLSCGSYLGDAERDGICDGWEAPTKTYLTIPYGGTNHVFSYACDPTCPNASNDDILLEIDTLNGGGPSANVLPDIQTLFDQRGYKLHYRINEAITIGGGDSLLNVWDDPVGDNNCNTVDSFREIKLKYFGEGAGERLGTTTDACNDPTIVNDKGAAKKQVWHYCLYGKTVKQKWSGGAVGTSGISEEIGNDCVVTLGDFAPIDQDKEKGTLMHELGHMFGLRHGGGVNNIAANPLTWIADSNANCKPNYISPMSYSHQFPNALGTVTLSYWTPSYSNVALPTYDATSTNSTFNRLNEELGPIPTSGTIDVAWAVNQVPNNKAIPWNAVDPAEDVDWNGGGIQADPPTATWAPNVNNFGFRDCDTATSVDAPGGVIRGFRDWNKLVLETRVHGGSNWDIPGSFATNELNNTVWMQIVESGVKVLNNKFQLLDSSVFSNPNSANVIKATVEENLIATPCDPEVKCKSSVIQHIQEDEIREALEGLSFVSRLYDGDVGGNATDDVIKDHDAKASLFSSSQGNSRVLVMQLLEKNDYAFGMAWSNYNDTYLVIMAESPTINATDGRFFVHEKDLNDPAGNNITFTVIGEGTLGLDLDSGLVNGDLNKENTIVTVDGNDVEAHFSGSAKGSFFGRHIDFTVPSVNGTGQIHKVVIMGANVVPEFPTTSTLVLALVILAIILITTIVSRDKNGFMSFSLPSR